MDSLYRPILPSDRTAFRPNAEYRPAARFQIGHASRPALSKRSVVATAEYLDRQASIRQRDVHVVRPDRRLLIDSMAFGAETLGQLALLRTDSKATPLARQRAALLCLQRVNAPAPHPHRMLNERTSPRRVLVDQKSRSLSPRPKWPTVSSPRLVQPIETDADAGGNDGATLARQIAVIQRAVVDRSLFGASSHTAIIAHSSEASNG